MTGSRMIEPLMGEKPRMGRYVQGSGKIAPVWVSGRDLHASGEGCLARSDVHGEAEVDVASGVPAADAPVFESDLVKDGRHMIAGNA